MVTARRFNLHEMRALKAQELPGLRNLLQRCIVRERVSYRLSEADGETSIIAEIKCASPSRGEINRVDSREQAGRYCRGGAVALSVLTDGNFFGGSWSDLYSVAQDVQVPVLCKEFVFFEEQIDVAWMLGADLVLLIARALEREELKKLYEHASCRGLIPLVEVHHPDELDAMMVLNPSHVLVNARNLETLQIESEIAISTWSKLPVGITAIWASGITTAEDLKKIKDSTGARFFLVGSALMESADPENLIRELRNVR